jgi:hypothetical protein
MTTSFFLTSFGGETSDKERTTSSVVVRRSFPTYDFKPNLCPDNDANSKMQWKTLSVEKYTFSTFSLRNRETLSLPFL